MRTAVAGLLLLLGGVGTAFCQKFDDRHRAHHRRLDPPRATIVDSVPIRQVSRPAERSTDDRIEKLERRIDLLERQLKETLDALLKVLRQQQLSPTQGR